MTALRLMSRTRNFGARQRTSCAFIPNDITAWSCRSSRTIIRRTIIRTRPKIFSAPESIRKSSPPPNLKPPSNSVLFISTANGFYSISSPRDHAMATECCPTDVKPVVNNYKGVGKYVTIEGHFDMYVTGSGTKAILDVYDIFGRSGHTEQFADLLATHGYVVCVPDFIADPWDVSNVPPTKDGKFPEGVTPDDGVGVLVNWIMTHHDTRLDRVDAIEAVKGYLIKNYNITKLGVVGMCWGGMVAIRAQGKRGDLFDAVAGCHVGMLKKENIEAVNVPLCLLNSKDEPESYTTDLKPILEATSPINVFKNFPTMHHGWMGTRGTGADTDFTKKELVEGFQEGFSDLVNFFNKALDG